MRTLIEKHASIPGKGKEMKRLEEEIEQFLAKWGAISVGFATLETLAGGPPSADITYVLPEAKSAVSFALPLDPEGIRAMLAKESNSGYSNDYIEGEINATEISHKLADWLEEKGYKAKGTSANKVFRKDIPGWEKTRPPEISHRYVAVRSGVGSFGWSGNVGIKGYGASIILGTVVTSAELEATDPIPDSDSFCDKCKLCVKSCAGGFFDMKREEAVTLGGKTFTHAARNSYTLCSLVCGGFTGISKDGKWSTWSPGRMAVPENATEAELTAKLQEAAYKKKKWPERIDGDGGHVNPPQFRLTCGNCQVVCGADKDQRKENYRLLKNSGCIIQRENGDIVVLPPDEAAEALEKMDPVHKALYTDP